MRLSACPHVHRVIVPVAAILLASCADQTIGPDMSAGNGRPTAPTIDPTSGEGMTWEYGCASLRIELSGRDRIAVNAEERDSCGAIELVIAGDPEFDRTVGTVRIPIALENSGEWALNSPVYVSGWEDSVRVVAPPGLAGNKHTGGYVDFAAADTVIVDSAGQATHVWSYDDRLAASGSSTTLAPGTRSGPRWIVVSVHDGVQVFHLTLGARGAMILPDVPTLSEERPGTWIELPDSALWEYIVASDMMAHIGLKAPGAVRGMYNGRILLNPGQWDRAETALAAVPGVEILEADTLLPIVRARFDDFDAFVAARSLPTTDYLEPVRVASEVPVTGDLGCDVEQWDGIVKYIEAEGFGQDLLPWNFSRMSIDVAWQRTQGQGVTIGIVDTGIDREQTELTTDFASGLSSGRRYEYVGGQLLPLWWDDCGHGTRMAGVIAAPRNGKNIVGVAYRSDLVSARHDLDGDVVNVDASGAANAIRYVNLLGARVISMAWQSFNAFWRVSNEIEYWHYSRDRLFIAVAGTSTCATTPIFHGVVFPADMDEVMAVTGVNGFGGFPCNVHHGDEVEVTAYIDQPTTGPLSKTSLAVVSIEGSSNATGVIAGIAALIWSYYPDMTRDEVRQRLWYAGSDYPAPPSSNKGHGVVNAYHALGGIKSVRIQGPTAIRPTEPTDYTYTAHAVGDGPFEYSWSTGETTQTITVRVGPDDDDFTLSVSAFDAIEKQEKGRYPLHAQAHSSVRVDVLNTPTAHIRGPTSVRPNDACYWEADVVGGEGGYSYEWYKNDVLVSKDRIYPDSFSASEGTVTLELFATDAAGQTDRDVISVTVDEDASACGF